MLLYLKCNISQPYKYCLRSTEAACESPNYLQSDHGFNVNGILSAFISLVKAERKFSFQLSQHALSPLSSLVCLMHPFITEPDSLCKLDGKWQSLSHKLAWLKWHFLWMTIKQVAFTRQHFEKATNVLLSNNFFSCIKKGWTVAIHFMTIKILLFRVKTSAAFILLDFCDLLSPVWLSAFQKLMLKVMCLTHHSPLWDSERRFSYFLIGKGNEACWSELGSELYPTQMYLVCWSHRPESKTFCQGCCGPHHKLSKYTLPVLFHSEWWLP